MHYTRVSLYSTSIKWVTYRSIHDPTAHWKVQSATFKCINDSAIDKRLRRYRLTSTSGLRTVPKPFMMSDTTVCYARCKLERVACHSTHIFSGVPKSEEGTCKHGRSPECASWSIPGRQVEDDNPWFYSTCYRDPSL